MYIQENRSFYIWITNRATNRKINLYYIVKMVYFTLLYTVETGILVNYLSYTARYIFFLYFLSDTENAGIFLCRNSPMKAYLFSETAECRYISFQKKPNAYLHISFQKQPNAGSFFFSETAQWRHISFQKQPNAGIFFFRKSPMQVHFFI